MVNPDISQRIVPTKITQDIPASFNKKKKYKNQRKIKKYVQNVDTKADIPEALLVPLSEKTKIKPKHLKTKTNTIDTVTLFMIPAFCLSIY